MSFFRGRRRRGADASGRMIYFRDHDILPEVAMIPDGEVFGGSWVIRRCSIGRAVPHGYEVRCLLSDNDHFATRREAVRAVFLQAMRTIELGEVGAVHLSPASSTGIQSRAR